MQKHRPRLGPGLNVRASLEKWHIVHASVEIVLIEHFLHHCRQLLDLRRTTVTCPAINKDLNCLRQLSKLDLQQRTTKSGTHLGRIHMFQLQQNRILLSNTFLTTRTAVGTNCQEHQARQTDPRSQCFSLQAALRDILESEPNRRSRNNIMKT